MKHFTVRVLVLALCMVGLLFAGACKKEDAAKADVAKAEAPVKKVDPLDEEVKAPEAAIDAKSLVGVWSEENEYPTIYTLKDDGSCTEAKKGPADEYVNECTYEVKPPADGGLLNQLVIHYVKDGKSEFFNVFYMRRIGDRIRLTDEDANAKAMINTKLKKVDPNAAK